jgi:hypothetical protein
MRNLINIIDEAHVFKTVKNQYVPGYRMAISTKGGGVVIDRIKSVVPDFDPSETLTIVDQADRAKYQVPLSNNTSASFKLQRENGDVIELQGTESQIESSLNGIGPAIDPNSTEVKPPNKGDTAEALLGGAMFAKLLSRNKGSIGTVTVDDVWKIFDNLKPVSGDDYMVRSKDLGGATDTIWFRLKVKNTVKSALTNPALRKKLTSWLLSPVNYVNSKEGTEYAEEFYKNGEPDELGVISDGLSAQSEKKTDVYTAVRDPETNTVKKELLPISLKAGAEQFAQHSGSKWKAMEDLFAHLGVTFQDPNIRAKYEQAQTNRQSIAAVSEVYKLAADIINSQFKTDQDEARFIKTVANAIRFWATSNQDNVRLVSFGNRGAFDVLRFDQLVPVMKTLQLRARFMPGENPKLFIEDVKTGRQLFQLRSYMQTKKDGTLYQRNIVEKGPLITYIADATGRHAEMQKTLRGERSKPAQQPAVTKPAVQKPQPQVEPAVEPEIEQPEVPIQTTPRQRRPGEAPRQRR